MRTRECESPVVCLCTQLQQAWYARLPPAGGGWVACGAEIRPLRRRKQKRGQEVRQMFASKHASKSAGTARHCMYYTVIIYARVQDWSRTQEMCEVQGGNLSENRVGCSIGSAGLLACAYLLQVCRRTVFYRAVCELASTISAFLCYCDGNFVRGALCTASFCLESRVSMAQQG